MTKFLLNNPRLLNASFKMHRFYKNYYKYGRRFRKNFKVENIFQNKS